MYKFVDPPWQYTTQPKRSFCCHFIDAKDAVLLLTFTNELVLVHIILISVYGFLVEAINKLIKNWQNFKKID